MSVAAAEPDGPAAGRLSPTLWSRLGPLWPAIAYGLRTWASVCLALFISFKLELQNPFWSATSAAIVCQPSLGASLRKGGFRMIGTVLGAVVIVLLTAAFPQNRLLFLSSIALWIGLCAAGATLLRNFAGYAAALSGYTAAIIFADALPDPAETFALAYTRASEIILGIACAGVVLATTDLGTARARLSGRLATLAWRIADGLHRTLSGADQDFAAIQAQRRALVGEVTTLGAAIDEAVGEASDLRARSATLQVAVDGLLTALTAWRAAANDLEAHGIRAMAAETARLMAPEAAAGYWTGEPPASHRARLLERVRALLRLRAADADARLLADRVAEGLLALGRTLEGLVLIDQPELARRPGRIARPRVPDLLPALLNAARAILLLGVMDVFWIRTGWQGGQGAVTFAAIGITLFAPREEQAYDAAMGFAWGTAATAGLAAIVQFAVLPACEGFPALCAVLAAVIVPLAALSTGTWYKSALIAAMTNFVPILAPDNVTTYDPAAFFNSALGIVAGTAAAAIAIRLVPPIPARVKTARLLRFAARDLRTLARRPARFTRADWERRLHGALLALPAGTPIEDAARLLAALSAGDELLRLHARATRAGLRPEEAALRQAVAQGRIPEAIGAARALAEALSAGPADAPRQRAVANTRVLAETLSRHSDYLERDD